MFWSGETISCRLLIESFSIFFTILNYVFDFFGLNLHKRAERNQKSFLCADLSISSIFSVRFCVSEKSKSYARSYRFCVIFQQFFFQYIKSFIFVYTWKKTWTVYPSTGCYILRSTLIFGGNFWIRQDYKSLYSLRIYQHSKQFLVTIEYSINY